MHEPTGDRVKQGPKYSKKSIRINLKKEMGPVSHFYVGKK
jgi:hypothetical protein